VKVLILTDNYPRKTAANSGIFIHRQVKALQQLGVECHVLLLHNWYPPFGLHTRHAYWREGHDLHSAYYTEFEGVKIHSVPMFVRIPGRLFKETHYDRAARAVTKYIKSNSTLRNADWLYAHFITESAYIAARVKDQLNMKLAAIARGDDIHAWPEENPALRNHFPIVFEKADLLLANSGNLGADARKWMQPGNMRDVLTVYNGIDHDEYHPADSAAEVAGLRAKYSLDANIKYVVCIATPVVLKGWIELLDAIKALGDEFNGWQLLMIAPPRNNPDAIDLQRRSEELGIVDKVRYIPGMSPQQLAELFRAVDGFVLPSYNEGMANALLEAMASGLPCIASEVGGHNEVIEHGKDGLLISPRSVSELTDAIRILISDADKRKQMGVMARKSMLRFGNYLHNSRKLLELFQRH
jgi:glycosyltransferase involved in cell wall biosynthesis